MSLKARAANLRTADVVFRDEFVTVLNEQLHRRRRALASAELLRMNPSGGACCGGSHLRMLSPREREAFLHIVAGRTIREISVEMSIRPKTAENYRQRVLEKLGVRCAVEAVHYAVRHGFLVLYTMHDDEAPRVDGAYQAALSSLSPCA